MSYMQGQWHRLNFSFKKHLDLSAVDVSPCMALCCRPLVRYHIITFDLQLQQSPHSHFRQN